MGIFAPSIDTAFEKYATRHELFTDAAETQRFTVRIPYNEAYALINEIIGVNIRSDLLDYTAYERSSLFLESAVIVPVISDPKPAPPNSEYYLYDEAEVTLTYSAAVPQILDDGSPGDPFTPWNPVEYFEVIEPRAEHQILDFNDYHWDSQPDSEKLKKGENPVRLLYGATYTVYWYNQQSIAPGFFSLAGSVNSLGFKSPGMRFFDAGTGKYNRYFEVEKEQMLYSPGAYSDSLYWLDASKTQRGYNYVCKWLVKLGDDNNTWNKFYRKTDNAAASYKYIYDELVSAKDQTTVYKNFRLMDHGTLLPS